MGVQNYMGGGVSDGGIACRNLLTVMTPSTLTTLGKTRCFEARFFIYHLHAVLCSNGGKKSSLGLFRDLIVFTSVFTTITFTLASYPL